jgi:diguanylate cyclase (GGDEF)-like protein/PAS domain S-box-containing protein
MEEHEESSRYVAFYEAALEGIAITFNGMIVDVNPQMARMFGYSREELIGKPALDLAAPESYELVSKNIQEELDQPYVAIGVRKDGTKFVGEVHGHATQYKGQPARVTAIRDVTEESRAQKIQTALYKISDATVKASTLEALFASIHSIIEELLPAENLYFALYDPINDTVTFPYLVDEYDYYPPRKSGRGLTEFVIRTGMPLSAPPGVLNELVNQGIVERLGTPVVDWFGVPLKSKGSVFGVVAVQSYTEGVHFGESERGILTFVSTQVAMAVERKQAEEELQRSQDRYKEFVQQVAEGVWRTELDKPMPLNLSEDEQIRYLHDHSYLAECNDVLAQMCGYQSAEGMIGRYSREVVQWEDEQVDFRRKFIRSNYRLRDHELRETGRDGVTRIFLSSAVGIIRSGMLVGIWGTQRDMTEQKAAEEALRASEERYRLLFERNLAGVFRANSTGKILDGNESFARMLGYEMREDVLSLSFWEFYPSKEERESFLFRLREHYAMTNIEACLRKRNGSPLWVLMNVTLLPGSTSASFFMEGTLIDITDRKLAEEQVAYQAYHDALTALPNRALFRDRLNQALARAQRHRVGLAVLFLDLDHFKLINDTLGHSIGDWLLKEIALRLRTSVRDGDTVARLGGDEFTILLPEVSEGEDAAHVAQKILDTISEPLRWDNHDIYITTSIGISLSPSDGEDSETLIKSADNAMYRAKELGRNNYQLWSPDLNTRVQNRLSLERSLRRAVDRLEFVMHYQPQFDLRTGKITGLEALLRWPRDESGLCYPKDFIPVAEETRLIVPIGEWMLREVCSQVKRWQENGMPDLRLSVNLSAMQFQAKNLIAHLDEVLEECNFNPATLVIEMTETVAMQNVDLTMAILHTMKRKGIKIALDDFGMGYSSLSYLKHFPIDIIKIDPSFIRDIGAGTQPEALVKAVIRLGHSLNQTIIAEGVETEAQRAFLLDQGCHEVQGFLFSPALPATEIWDKFLSASAPRQTSHCDRVDTDNPQRI